MRSELRFAALFDFTKKSDIEQNNVYIGGSITNPNHKNIVNQLENFGEWQSEWQLWSAVRAGDELAFTYMFEHYHAHLYNYGAKLTRDINLLEDAIQEVFIDIWRLRSSLTDKVLSVRYYLMRCLRRQIHKSTARQTLLDALDMLPASEILYSDFTDYETKRIEAEKFQQEQDLITTLLGDLPTRQAEAITLRYFEGLSTVQIATLMGVSQKSVRNFLYKALQSMRMADVLRPIFLIFSANQLIF